MKKQKSEIYFNKSEIFGYMIITFLLGIMITAIYYTNFSFIKKENLNLHNENADLWCKSQSYDVVLEKKILQEYKNKSCFILYEWKKNNSGFYEEVNLTETFSVETELMKKSLENLTFDNMLELSNLPFGWLNSHEIECPYYAKTETRSFETGYYNETDNSRYCQAEPKENFCSIENPVGYALNKTTGKRLPICSNNIEYRNKNPTYSNQDRSIVGYFYTEYQKVEKFPYK